MKKITDLLLLGLVAALLGGSVGAVTAGFLHFIEWAQRLLWEVISVNLPWQTLLVCTLGGVLVGLCQRYLGDHPQTINEAIATINKTGRLDYTHLPHGLATISVSLIFGASLGPESAIIDLLGGLGTWVGDMIRSLRQRFDLPRPAQAKNRLEKLLQSWPNLIALLVGTVAFLKLLAGLYGGGFLNFREAFQWSDLLWSIPCGLIGAAGGYLFMRLQTWTKKLAAPLKQKPVLRGTLGGFALGLLALFLPLMLFSGQHGLQQAYDQAAQLGFVTLLLIALARLFIINGLLATGWKGGQFLPIMFSGAALGLAISVLFPAIPAPAAVLSAMAALLAVVIPRPIIALILMALMFPLQYVGISVVAVGLVMLGQRLWKKRPGQALPETAVQPASD
ncbi:MAG TPA: chloride channel protein [Anaerolineales bacterium]|nr:chloride channel protein [Anaerolineales bacterium]